MNFSRVTLNNWLHLTAHRAAGHRRRNTIRINDNVTRLLQNIVGITKDVKGTLVWAADEVVYAPEIAVSGVRVDEIALFMESLE
jgi:predicted Zn-dependent protease